MNTHSLGASGDSLRWGYSHSPFSFTPKAHKAWIPVFPSFWKVSPVELILSPFKNSVNHFLGNLF